MADPHPSPDSSSDRGSDTSVRPDRELITSIPLWVKVFGIIALIVVLLFLIVMLTGVGGHGPDRHIRSEGGQTPPSGITEHWVQQL